MSNTERDYEQPVVRSLYASKLGDGSLGPSIVPPGTCSNLTERLSSTRTITYPDCRRLAHVLVATTLFITVAALSGCPTVTVAQFSNSNIDDMGPQRPAAILVGDPQVIARETLINDRLREIAHIDGLIAQSSSQDFSPQILRDLAVVQALSAQFGVASDPALGRAALRDKEIDDLRHRIELFTLREELDSLLQPKKTDESANEPTPDVPTNSAAASDGEGPSIDMSSSSKTRLDELVDVVSRINEKLTTLLPSSQSSFRARIASVKASPEESFADEDAYRSLLRHRRNEIALDDTHDVGGNTLYRLQFTTTVLPGKTKNKFGVLDFGVVASRTSDQAIRQLYHDWLVALTLRGFYIELDKQLQPAWEVTHRILVKRRLVSVVPFYAKLEDDDIYTVFPLFVHPEDYDKLSMVVNFDRGERFDSSELFKEVDKWAKSLVKDQSYLTKAEVLCKNYSTLLPSIRLERTFRAYFLELSSLRDHYNLKFVTPLEPLQSFFSNVSLLKPYCHSTLTEDPPRSFVIEVAEKVDDGYAWRGEVFTYQVQPDQRVQRMSTLASAINSMQAALLLGAAVPASGIGLNAGIGASRSVVGVAEAIERTPLIVGYTDSGKKKRFGFLFGPRVIIDPSSNKLEYRHIPASYPVYADVSVPSWWPDFDLETRSVWAGNWHDTEQVLLRSEVTPRRMKVRLRPKRSDIYELTPFLLQSQFLGLEDVPTIESVYPSTVSACDPEIQFVVQGSDLWRGAQAYLRGTRHKSLAVLPDMNGVVVTFNMSELPRLPGRVVSDGNGSWTDRLLIWTNHGQAQSITGENGIGITIVNPIDDDLCNTRQSATVEFDKQRLVGEGPHVLQMTVGPEFPRGSARDVRLIARLHPDGFGPQAFWTSTDIAKVLSPEQYRGEIKIPPIHGWEIDALAGARLYVGVQFTQGTTGRFQQKFADDPIIYYPSKELSGFRVRVSDDRLVSEKIILDIPVRLVEAYPNFVQTSRVFVVDAIVEKEKIELDVQAEWNLSEGTVTLTIDPDEAFRKEWCSENLKLSLSLMAEAGSDVPGVTGDLMLKRRVCG